MNVAKVFGFAKKGSKKAKRPKGAQAAAVKWPPGTKIGVFGHENTGKTVYFTVLHHESKIAKNIQISVTDNLTSCEFLSNYMAIWGLDSGTPMGTVIDTAGEKKFPDPTVKDTVLQFTAILDGRRKVPVVTYDYNGKAVSISEHSDESEKVKEFMAAADGILFFFDPKILGADLEVQARVSAFINILEQVAPLKSRLPIPVGLVVTKADTLAGYTGEERTVLINPEDEHFFAGNFEQLLENVLNSGNVTRDSAWASTVRKIMVKLREFLRVVAGRTLDFQIFFVSNTGNKPEKIGADIGRSIYKPPEKINPCGVKEPFYWILNAVARNKRFNVMRRIVKYVAAASIIWVVLYSLPFLYHFAGLLSRPYGIENGVLESVGGNHYLITSEAQLNSIIRAYDRYGNKWLVKKMFPGYQIAADRMEEVYRNFNMGPALARLDSVVVTVTGIVTDPKLEPKYNPGKDSLIYDDIHKRVVSDLERMHVGDKTSVLFLRSDRVLDYWNLFTQFIKNPNDTTVVEAINRQVTFNMDNAPNYSESEKRLGDALLGRVSMAGSKAVRPAPSVRSVADEYTRMKERVNGSTSPDFVLGEAVVKLQAIRGNLRAGVHDEQISSINAFLESAARWKKKQQFTCVLQTVPDMGHLHIEVTESGGTPSWSKETQLLEGDEVKFTWKAGDDIHIAFDELQHPCNWGNQPSDRIVLQEEYSIFKMEGSIVFPNIGKTVVISFKGGLQLPKLE